MKSVSDRIIELFHSDLPFTDIHVLEGAPLRILTPRGWITGDETRVSRDDLETLVKHIEPDWKAKLATGEAINRAIDLPTIRIRANIYTTGSGSTLNVTVRGLPPTPRALKDTGLPPWVAQMLERGNGLVLVTGATGSGKTTTLAAMLRHINETRPSHIVTIEDPIEYVVKPQQCIVSQKEVGTDTASYLQGLKDALRQRPNVIMIGEVRDRETANTMLQAAESGHLVMATLHATSAIGAINKLISFFPNEEAEQRRHALANSLIGVIYQVLLPKAALDGFVLAAETLVNIPQVAKALEEPGRIQVIRDHLRRGENRMSRALNDVLMDLVATKKVTSSDALRAAYDNLELKQRLDQGVQKRAVA